MKIFKLIIFSILSFVIIFLLGYVLARTFMIFYTRHRNEVVVPDLVNKDYKKAQHDLYKEGLYIDKKGERNSSEILAGSILAQDPPANSMVKKGYTIDVIVSKGPELVKIPSLDNLSVDEAKIRLMNIGLEIGSINYSYSNEIMRRKVIYSQPISGMNIPKNSKVNLVVSLGKIPANISGEKGIYDTFLEELENENE
ncbi:MAG: PASTA domain-containing protein [Candidatus Cloacimonetes bacterium]|nr:PASTA domain-containing protein [Candidatus Cloacimonadota bacterium]MBL7086079.1 PASTA domain-containing protein [Candidatus Cloacimonadota bacterium]